MRTFLVCLFALAPAVLFADTLSPQEAHSILRQAQQASRDVGSFKEVKTEKTKLGARTITIYTLRPADGPKSSRTETVTTIDGHPERTQTSVSLTTAEGNVQLFKHHALIDEAQNRVIETTTYNAAGKMLAKEQPGAVERIPDLSPEIFVIPPGLEVVRATGFIELIRLRHQPAPEPTPFDQSVPPRPGAIHRM
jgi:hypothetical protein